MLNNIYISTTAFVKQDINSILSLAYLYDLNIEFSSGLLYNANIEEKFKQATIKRLVHNYFPAPKEPFVLNLASSDEIIRRKSINMCLHGLELSKLANSPFYSAHAGFCIDPQPHQLGKQLGAEDLKINRAEHWNIFVSSIKEILNRAQELDIMFLIENNVIASFNLTASLENSLLCCSSEEILKLNSDIDDELFGILLDTAHLKVSCKTLGLDRMKELEVISPIIKALHHSDNDAEKDTNCSLTKDYWCQSMLRKFKNNVHVLEVKSLTINEIKDQENLLSNFIK